MVPEDYEIRRLKYLAFGLAALLVVILAVLVVTRIVEHQQAKTKRELDEYISNLATAKNTFKLAHKEITQAEMNLTLKVSQIFWR